MKTWLVNDGPSKFDLMASLFDNKIVKFTLRPSPYGKEMRFDASVLSVKKSMSKEKKAKNFWDIEIIPVGISYIYSFKDEDCNAFSGFYDSKTRKGNLEEIVI